jgi:hypothetical protein
MYRVCNDMNHHTSASPYYRLTVPETHFIRDNKTFHKTCFYCRDRDNKSKPQGQVGVCKSNTHTKSYSGYNRDKVPLIYLLKSTGTKTYSACLFCRKRRRKKKPADVDISSPLDVDISNKISTEVDVPFFEDYLL